jgi:hypothetical protein
MEYLSGSLAEMYAGVLGRSAVGESKMKVGSETEGISTEKRDLMTILTDQVDDRWNLFGEEGRRTSCSRSKKSSKSFSR